MKNAAKQEAPASDRDAEQVSRERRSLVGSGATSAAAALLGLVAVACGDDETGSGGGGSGSTSTSGSPASGSTSTAQQGSSAAQQSSSAGQGGEGGGQGGQGGGEPGVDADIVPLNALLAAEYNAITAYSAGAGLIDGAADDDPLFDLRAVIIDIAVSFQTDHRLHAEALVAAIEDLGGTPVDEDDVADAFEPPQALLDNPTITNVLKFAASAERGAAVAYNQVLATLEAARFRFLAGAIGGDESQHFIVLAALVAGLAAPGPNLSSDTATDVVPTAFSSTVGDEEGLDVNPPDYFP